MRASNILLIFMAMILYGVQNTLQGRFFSKVNPFSIMVVMYLPMMCASFLVLWWMGQTRLHLQWDSFWGTLSVILCVASGACLWKACGGIWVLPALTPREMQGICMAACVLFMANVCCFYGYSAGATVEVVTTATLLMPISSAVFKMIMRWGQQPDSYIAIAWLLGAVILYLLYLSESKNLVT